MADRWVDIFWEYDLTNPFFKELTFNIRKFITTPQPAISGFRRSRDWEEIQSDIYYAAYTATVAALRNRYIIYNENKDAVTEGFEVAAMVDLGSEVALDYITKRRDRIVKKHTKENFPIDDREHPDYLLLENLPKGLTLEEKYVLRAWFKHVRFNTLGMLMKRGTVTIRNINTLNSLYDRAQLMMELDDNECYTDKERAP